MRSWVPSESWFKAMVSSMTVPIIFTWQETEAESQVPKVSREMVNVSLPTRARRTSVGIGPGEGACLPPATSRASL